MSVDFYLPGESIIHRFDPRAKLILLAAAVACFFLPIPQMASAAYLAVLAILLGLCLGIRELVKSLLAIAPLLLIILILTPLLTRTGGVIWSPFGYPLATRGGMDLTVRLLVRFSGITFGFYLAFRTIEVNDLARIEMPITRTKAVASGVLKKAAA